MENKEKDLKEKDLKEKLKKSAEPLSQKIIKKTGKVAAKAVSEILLTTITYALKKTITQKIDRLR